MLERIKTCIKKQNFDPGFLGIITNPFYIARRGLAKNIRQLSGEIKGRVLDVGCGTKPYQNFFDCDEYTGLEIDSGEEHKNKCADIFYDGKIFPFENSTFDCIILNQVFEHVFNPDEFLDEVKRVLKPGGKVLMTVPFIWDEHEQPWDYARYSSFGLKSILEKHIFNVVSQRKSVNDFSIMFQLINAWLYKKLAIKNKYLNYFLLLIFIFPMNIAGIITGRILPMNNDCYLDNVVLAETRKGML